MVSDAEDSARGDGALPARFEASPEFRRLLDGEPRPSLLRIALEIAGDAYPGLDPSRYLTAVDDLAVRVRERCGTRAKSRTVLGQINWALFVEEGYEGNRDNYFDPRNSYLNEVVDRKRGIPISLSVLYLSLAARLGITLEGVNLPAHFMLRLDEPGTKAAGAVFIDPFHAGELLDQHGCQRRIAELTHDPLTLSEHRLAPCSARVIVSRMLRNLKAIYVGMNDHASALPVQRRLAALERNDAVEQRDLGMICLQADQVGEAIDPLAA
jgi:regulator of sirC expression with transglutaminase-like and TPR domain